MNVRSRLQTIVSAVYPSVCLGCGEMVDSDFGLCGSCWRDTWFIGGCVCDGCGVPLLGEDEAETFCDSCLTAPRPWRKARAAILYRGMGRKLVLGLKHGDRQDVVRPAANWLRVAARDLLIDPNCLIAPIPLHWLRRLKRRYNQSALLAQALAQQTGYGWCPDLLLRPRMTPSLEGKSREERFDTLKGSITINPRRRRQMIGRSVLLIDDVMTSGATFSAASRACLDAGAEHVNVLALARADRDT